ncbi:MAG: isoprenylcysteine carboxylmethyltransferase family protein [Alphaproteobacteria bacterium]|nr:isoprenylcysteine carboxylmethyltransferase family protein [Alphaproteobacteria bacterium]
MRLGSAALGSALFFVLAPGIVAGVVPWALSHWDLTGVAGWGALEIAGAAIGGLGALVLVSAFVRFVAEGGGTPAPVAPTERLVIGGLYRHVRNPMYLAALAVIAGQGMLFRAPVLGAYALFVAFCFLSFVKLYEEPVLQHRFGPAYRAYRHAVPAWLSRLTPARLERD